MLLDITYNFNLKPGFVYWEVDVQLSDHLVTWEEFREAMRRFRPVLKARKRYYSSKRMVRLCTPKHLIKPYSPQEIPPQLIETVIGIMENDLNRYGRSIANSSVIR